MRNAFAPNQGMQQIAVQEGMGQKTQHDEGAGTPAHKRPAAFFPPAFLNRTNCRRTGFVKHFGLQPGLPHAFEDGLFVNGALVEDRHRAINKVEIKVCDAGQLANRPLKRGDFLGAFQSPHNESLVLLFANSHLDILCF